MNSDSETINLEYEYVVCNICGLKLKRLSDKHIKSHGITTKEYKEIYPGSDFVSQKIKDNQSKKLKGHLSTTKGKELRHVRRGVYKACKFCGNEYYIPRYKINTSNYCSKNCTISSIAESHLGKNHHNWRGGRKDYYGENWNSQKRLARKRDNDICQVCGITSNDIGKQLDVHHIVPFRNFGVENYEEANDLNNLVSLCYICHARITNGKKLIINNTLLSENSYERRN